MTQYLVITYINHQWDNRAVEQTKEEFVADMLARGYHQDEPPFENDTPNMGLRGQPRFKEFAGPMEGDPVVRYEDWEANDVLSR